MTDYERDIAAIATWERDEQPRRSTGPRRTQDDVARCYECGQDIDDDRPFLFDGRTFCSRAHLDAWVRR